MRDEKGSLRREVEREFWRQVAQGLRSAEAAVAGGASQAAGSRWFRERGGLPAVLLARVAGRCLSFVEREGIALVKAQGAGSGGSPVGWVVIPPRSRGNCAGTRS